MQEKRLCRSVFLKKLQALACNFIKKETLALVFSCEFFKISKHTFSYRKRERQRDREGRLPAETILQRQTVRLPAETVLQYPTLMLSSRRGHSIDVSDNIYGCLSGFKIMSFRIVSDSASNFFSTARSSCL